MFELLAAIVGAAIGAFRPRAHLIAETQTAITAHTGASVNGRLMAQTAVSIDGSTVVQPAP